MANQIVVWSPETQEDVDDIAAYIARGSVFYAGAVVEKMLATAAELNLFPEAGRVVPELNQPDLRERFVYSYRLIYKVEITRILIVAAIHGRRLLDEAVADRMMG